MANDVKRLSADERRAALEDVLDANLLKLKELIGEVTGRGMGIAWANVEKSQVALARLEEHERTKAEKAAGVSRYAWMSGFDPSLLVYGSQSAPVPQGDA